MKKWGLILGTGLLLLVLQSCAKYCECALDGENPTELEIPFSDNCTDYSDQIVGNCR